MTLCGQAVLVREDQRNRILRSLPLYQLQAKTSALNKGFCFQGHLGNMLYFFPFLVVAELVGTGGALPCFADLKGCSISHLNLFVQGQFEGSFVR